MVVGGDILILDLKVTDYTAQVFVLMREANLKLIHTEGQNWGIHREMEPESW